MLLKSREYRNPPAMRRPFETVFSSRKNVFAHMSGPLAKRRRPLSGPEKTVSGKRCEKLLDNIAGSHAIMPTCR
jgi:hypothetical protein